MAWAPMTVLQATFDLPCVDRHKRWPSWPCMHDYGCLAAAERRRVSWHRVSCLPVLVCNATRSQHEPEPPLFCLDRTPAHCTPV